MNMCENCSWEKGYLLGVPAKVGEQNGNYLNCTMTITKHDDVVFVQCMFGTCLVKP